MSISLSTSNLLIMPKFNHLKQYTLLFIIISVFVTQKSSVTCLGACCSDSHKRLQYNLKKALVVSGQTEGGWTSQILCLLSTYSEHLSDYRYLGDLNDSFSLQFSNVPAYIRSVKRTLWIFHMSFWVLSIREKTHQQISQIQVHLYLWLLLRRLRATPYTS